jgi:uncharacterized protein YjbJ (UPF0337 family)
MVYRPSKKGNTMNRDTMKGSARELKGKIKAKWGRLTDQDLTEVEGNMEALSGKLQKVYGRSREEADKEVREFRNSEERDSHKV